MTKLIQFADAEQAERVDFDAISLAAREGDENITGGAVGYPNHWAEFTVTAPSPTTLRVSQGRYFEGEKIFDLDVSQDINLTTFVPFYTTDQRWIAIIARGVTETVTASRMVEVDAEAGETVAQSLPKTVRRRVDFSVQAGEINVTPVRPVIDPGDCCVCFVLLGQTGVVVQGGIAAIAPGNDWRVKTLYEVEGRLTVLEGRVNVVFQQVASLQTDLANVQAALTTIPRPELIRQFQRDLARMRRLLQLPDDARAYFYDPGLVRDQWDLAHGSWNARIREGLRFPYTQESDTQRALIDPDSPAIRLSNSVMLPAWTEQNRITVDGSGSFRNISDQVHTVTTAVRREVSRSAIEFGPTIAYCENQGEWAQVGAARVGETFQVNGETFQSLGVINSATPPNVDLSVLQTWNPDLTIERLVSHNSQPGVEGHRGFAAQQVITREWTETHWDYVTETFGVNGSTYGQSFLLSQPMILTSIEIKMTRVGSTGTLHLALCEVGATGAPDFSRVIARASLEPSALVVGWNKFNFPPRFLRSGRRYAWFTVTTGNHALQTVTGNTYAQGSLFVSTDGAWAQGSTEDDFAFRLNAARFTTNRAVVEFTPITLSGGMTQFALFYEGWAPDGCSVQWEWQATGDDEWYPLVAQTPSALSGLPALLRLRATLIGTSDLAPAIVMNARARAMAQRHAVSMMAITKPLVLGFNTTSVTIETMVDNFDPLHNTALNRLVIGSTVHDPVATTTEADITKAGRYKVTSTFTVPSSGTVRVRVAMTTDSVLRIPFVQDISMFAI